MQHIYLVRHGTTEFMEDARVQGATDSPLSPRGRREAAQAADALQHIDFDHAFCSPLGRTRETAQIICSNKDIQPQIMNDLREMDFGWFEGSKQFDVPGGKIGLWRRASVMAKFGIAQLTGEPMKRVIERSRQAFQQILQRAAEGSVLVVAHGMLLTCMLGTMTLEEPIEDITSLRLKPCSITEVEIDDQSVTRLIHLNSTNHISANKSRW